MIDPTTWHGTSQEAEELRGVLEQHCTCQTLDPSANPLGCPAHALLASQRMLDGLLFGRRLRRRLLGEEFGMPLAERRAP